MPRPKDEASLGQFTNQARAKMAIGEEGNPVRKHTLRITLEIDVVEMPPDRYGEIWGMAKDRGTSVPQLAAEEFENIEYVTNHIASYIQRAVLSRPRRQVASDPLPFQDPLDYVNVKEVRVVQADCSTSIG
jgi:hypothetical protein